MGINGFRDDMPERISFIKTAGCTAKGLLRDGYCVVKSGARIAGDTTDTITPDAQDMRDDLISRRKVKKVGNYYITREDAEFSSLCHAESFITGRRATGYRQWKTSCGTPLSEWKNNQSEKTQKSSHRSATRKRGFNKLLNKTFLKAALLEKFGSGCQGCGMVTRGGNNLVVDHHVPRCCVENNDINNLILLCTGCNSKKGKSLTVPGLRIKLRNEHNETGNFPYVPKGDRLKKFHNIAPRA